MITQRTETTFTCDVCGYALATVDDGLRRTDGKGGGVSSRFAYIPEGWVVSSSMGELTCSSCNDFIQTRILDAETAARAELAVDRKDAVT